MDLKHFRRTVKTDWAKEAEQMKEISMDFFRDEVRNGFFIPTAVKQAWAAQLQVLDVIETICRKHDITYFADWGTILGTVRHGGYVPWDDDMDICMKERITRGLKKPQRQNCQRISGFMIMNIRKTIGCFCRALPTASISILSQSI